MPNTPDFNDESTALKYWESNKRIILDANFYNDTLVIIRKEVHNVCTTKLN